MDLLSQHEAFLRAIFDAPDDDTPRLVYADFLQENGDEDLAQFIRLSCDLARVSPSDHRRMRLLLASVDLAQKHQQPGTAWPWKGLEVIRGFPKPARTFLVTKALLTDPIVARWETVKERPECFGSQDLAIDPGLCLKPQDIDLLFALPAVQRISEWRLNGSVREELAHSGPGAFDLIDLIQERGIGAAGVEALARHRGARRIVSLDLRNNDLDSDAARTLVKSPYLDNLKRLDLLQGNRLRGKVWQQVIERFGEDVVG